MIYNEHRFHHLMHYPQAVLVFGDDMQLITANELGAHAIEKHWIGLEGNKIHFNSHKTNGYVKRIIDQITQAEPASRCFVLHCIDSVFRTYTLMHNPVAYDSTTYKEYALIIQGDLVCDDGQINSLAEAFSLSESEAKILKLMVCGLKPKEIGYEKGISLSTVRSHLRTLYAKMNVRNYNDALILAVRLLR